MKLYREVLIESVEQAEALPVGTVALTDYHGVAIRLDYGLGWSGAGDEPSFHHEEMVGGTALVPTEVFEGPGGHGRSWYVDAPDWE